MSDLTPTAATNGWGPIERDRSNGGSGTGDGKVLTLNGQTFAKGLGVHAASEVSYSLGASCSSFSASVGMDDETTGGLADARFQVWGDTTLLADSGVMTSTTPTKVVTADLRGRTSLRLVVTTGGDNNWEDHADWANAAVTCG